MLVGLKDIVSMIILKLISNSIIILLQFYNL